MAKLVRAIQKVFASTANAGEIAKFGSLAAGTPVFTTDPTVIQALSNYLDGWFASVLGGNSPAIEDMNALHFLYARQLAYLFQAGIAEWETGTVYYIGSLAMVGGVIYQSLADNNSGNAVTDPTKWAVQAGSRLTKTANYTLLSTDNVILGDATGGDFTLTLPNPALNEGKVFKIKKIDETSGIITIASSALMDGETTQALITPYTTLELLASNSTYYIL